MKHKKKSKADSSSDDDSDSSASSSSGSSDSASSDDSHKKRTLKKKKTLHPHTKETKKSHNEHYDSFSIDSYKEAQRKTHRPREDPHHFKRPQIDKESHARHTKERHRDEERKARHTHDNSHEKRNFRNDRDSEDPDKYRRHRHHDQYNNHNRSDYQRDDTRERNRRPEAPRHNERYNRDPKQYDDRRGSRFNRNNRDRSRSRSFDHTKAKWGKHEDGKKEKAEPAAKEKPNFGLSGKLTEERNTYKGVLIKYSEPPEARKPKRRWRLYPFKGEKALQTLFIHRESAYLIGRERKVVDLPVDHPSCSKQHAALQYRLVPFTRDDGSAGKRVRPYLIDLDSANGTYINNKKVEPKKYIELLERDVIKFGFSSREYVLLHENSKDEIQDDDVKLEEEEEAVKKEVDVKEEEQ